MAREKIANLLGLVVSAALAPLVIALTCFAALLSLYLPKFLKGSIGAEIRSFFNRKELNVFGDYVRKLNEFGLGKFELKRLGRSVTILLDGAPVALYKHYDNKIVFPVLEDYFWVLDKKPNDSDFMGAVLVGCLASPLYAKLKEQKKNRSGLFLGGFYYFIPPQGGRKVVFQIFNSDSLFNLNYSLVLPPVGMDTDPENYSVRLIAKTPAPHCSKIETNLPYKAVAQFGFPDEVKGLLHL